MWSHLIKLRKTDVITLIFAPSSVPIYKRSLLRSSHYFFSLAGSCNSATFLGIWEFEKTHTNRFNAELPTEEIVVAIQIPFPPSPVLSGCSEGAFSPQWRHRSFYSALPLLSSALRRPLRRPDPRQAQGVPQSFIVSLLPEAGQDPRSLSFLFCVCFVKSNPGAGWSGLWFRDSVERFLCFFFFFSNRDF